MASMTVMVAMASSMGMGAGPPARMAAQKSSALHLPLVAGGEGDSLHAFRLLRVADAERSLVQQQVAGAV